jgi:hypothetical protein
MMNFCHNATKIFSPSQEVLTPKQLAKDPSSHNANIIPQTLCIQQTPPPKQLTMDSSSSTSNNSGFAAYSTPFQSPNEQYQDNFEKRMKAMENKWFMEKQMKVMKDGWMRNSALSLVSLVLSLVELMRNFVLSLVKSASSLETFVLSLLKLASSLEKFVLSLMKSASSLENFVLSLIKSASSLEKFVLSLVKSAS